MDNACYSYKGKLWTQCLTTSDNDSFFHSVFGVRTDDEPYFDKQAKFRRMRWVAFLTYFENETAPAPLADILGKCLSASDKHKHVSIDNKQNFAKYVTDIMTAARYVTNEEIPIVATLENVKIVVLSHAKPDPIVINPNSDILGSYQNVCGKLKEVVLCTDGNMFSRLELLRKDSSPKIDKNKVVEKKTDPSKYKKGGSAGSKGVEYQVSLLALVILNSLKNALGPWKLSTENEEAGKFDDIVLECPEGTVLIQCKHKEDKKKKVTWEELTSTNSKHDDFSLPKYFLWFQVVKAKFNVQNVIICTNARAQDKALKFLDHHEADSKSLLYYEDCSYHTLNEKVLKDLRQKTVSYYRQNFKNKGVEESVITDDNLKGFLKHLQLYFNYPPPDAIKKIIDKLLSVIKCCNNSQGKTTSLEIYTKVMDWFQQKEGVYLTELHAKAMFSEIWRDRYCEKLSHYKVSFQRNDLSFEGPRQIFHVVAKGRYLLHLIKVYLALHDDKTKILYMDPEDDVDARKLVVEAFGLSRYVFLIIIWPKVADKSATAEVYGELKSILEQSAYKKIILVADDDGLVQQIGLGNDTVQIDRLLTFQDLSSASQARLISKKNIIFQGRKASLEELLPARITGGYEAAINSEILEKLIRGEDIKVGSPASDLDELTRQYYINRTFSRTFNAHDEKSNSRQGETNFQYQTPSGAYQDQAFKEINEEYSEIWSDENREEAFPEDGIFDVNEKVLLIADSAGTGKSTVLIKLALTIKEIHPCLWVVRVVLNDFTRMLGDLLDNGKDTLNITQLLNSKKETKLTNHLEKCIFSSNQKVVLMLDGIDEISPDYTTLVISLIKQCKEEPNFIKVFVTTRPHVIKELEKVLKVKPFILKPFTEQNQIDFLTNYWVYNLELKDDASRENCKRHAKQVIDNISWTNLDNNTESHFASIPLHVRMAAEIFQDTIGDEAEPNRMKKINVTNLYDLFFDKKWRIFNRKENPERRTWANQELTKQFNMCRVYHRSLALEVIVDKDKLRYFSDYRRSDTYIETNLLKMGIVQRFNDEFHFVHRTFADYFVGESLMIELQRNRTVEFQVFLIDTIFLRPQYNITRIFFDSSLRKVVDSLPSNIFHQYMSVKRGCSLDFYMMQSKLIHVLAEEDCVAILRLILKCADVQVIGNKEVYVVDFYATLSDDDARRDMNYNTLNVQKCLIEQAGFNIKDENGHTPLHKATLKGHTDMVRLLTEGTKVDNRNNNGDAPTYSNGGLSGKYLAELPESVHIKDNHGYTALHLAACFGQLETVKFLVKCGTDSKVTNNNSRTLLHSASANGHLEMVKFLLDLGLDVEIKDNGGNTALHLAACFGQLETVKFLMEYGMDPEVTNNNNRTLLHSASGNGQVETAKFLLKFGIDPKIRDNYGNTALHLAACFGQLETVKFLVEYGLDINDTNNLGRTLLHLSSANGHLDTVKLLLELGVDFGRRGNDGNTALHLAAYCGQLNTVKMLVEYGLDVDVTANHGRTLLHLACVKGHLKTVAFLLKLGLDFKARDDDGYTALHLATCFGQLSTVKFLVNLLESNARFFLKYGDYNVTNKTGHTLLHSATAGGHMKTIKFLLDLGVYFNVRDNEGYTVLHLAARFGQLDTVKFLVENGQDFKVTNNTGRTLLHSASAGGHLQTVQFLLDLGLDPNITDNDGNTALHLAVSMGQLETVKFYVEYGIDFNVTGYLGRTLLHLASANDQVDTVEFLLQLGLGFDIRDNYDNMALHVAAGLGQLNTVKFFAGYCLDNITGNRGRTVLHLASANGQLETVKFLMQLGVDFEIRDNYGNTALHLAARFGQLETVKFLIEYGLDFNVMSNNGRTLLHSASENGQLETVKFLVELGVDVKIKDNYDNTALHLAAGFGHLDTVKFLVGHGLDFNLKGNHGRTLLHLACANGHLETAKFLLELGVNFRARNNDGLTALNVATRFGHLDMVKLLKEHIARTTGKNGASCRIM